MTDSPATPIDSWEATSGMYAPPICLGRPDAKDSDRWFLMSDIADLRTGVLDQILSELGDTRGYLDGKAQGGGFSLFISSIANGIVFRGFDGVPVPVIPPNETWVRLSPYGNPGEIRIERAETVEPSRPAVRQQLRTLFDPVFAAIRERTRFPLIAQWAQLESGIAYGLLHADMVPQQKALDFLRELFEPDTLLRKAQPSITWIELDGRLHAFSTRKVCCFNFRGSGGHYCSSQCPTVPEPERIAAATQAARR